MIHKYNVNEDWVKDDKWNSIKPGMEIDFYIKDIIVSKKKIILTQIQRESIWDIVDVGNVFNGEVISAKPFGYFVKLDEETNGLIKTNQNNKNNVKLKVGDKVRVKVSGLIKDDRKILLNLVK
jgi:ribosomal protein S1